MVISRRVAADTFCVADVTNRELVFVMPVRMAASRKSGETMQEAYFGELGSVVQQSGRCKLTRKRTWYRGSSKKCSWCDKQSSKPSCGGNIKQQAMAATGTRVGMYTVSEDYHVASAAQGMARWKPLDMGAGVKDRQGQRRGRGYAEVMPADRILGPPKFLDRTIARTTTSLVNSMVDASA